MRDVHVGLALFADEAIRDAALPLFVDGEVDAIEWTLDHGWELPEEPAWTAALLGEYAAADRLYGHGVTLSPTSAQPHARVARWLANLERETQARRYRHVTEHWGCSRAGPLERGAPLPLPASEATIACTTVALRAMASAAGVPIGLENLALALSQKDVDAQPAMLARVLDAIDGVLLLDLHNVWCQAINYERDVRELVARYPLHRVRELHVAGGTWSTSQLDGRRFRRDTHDALVPDEVLELLAWVVSRCPALEVVIVERLPGSLADQTARETWRSQWRQIANVVRSAVRELHAVELAPPTEVPLHTVEQLAGYQAALVETLLASPPDVRAALLAHPATLPFRDQVAGFEPRALEVAALLAVKWGVAG